MKYFFVLKVAWFNWILFILQPRSWIKLHPCYTCLSSGSEALASQSLGYYHYYTTLG